MLEQQTHKKDNNGSSMMWQLEEEEKLNFFTQKTFYWLCVFDGNDDGKEWNKKGNNRSVAEWCWNEETVREIFFISIEWFLFIFNLFLWTIFSSSLKNWNAIFDTFVRYFVPMGVKREAFNFRVKMTYIGRNSRRYFICRRKAELSMLTFSSSYLSRWKLYLKKIKFHNKNVDFHASRKSKR